MVRVKICGITNLDDALAAAYAGADMLGFNFFAQSPRSISLRNAQTIAQALRAELGEICPLLAGVFVNESCHTVSAVGMFVGLDFAQLSGNEPHDEVARLAGMAVKAIRPHDPASASIALSEYIPYAPKDQRIPSLMVDAFHPSLYGGTGQQTSIDIALAVQERVPRMMLAGGLTPDNIAERVQMIRPWGVDVASGVENGIPGRKDFGKMRAFIEEAQAAGFPDWKSR